MKQPVNNVILILLIFLSGAVAVFSKTVDRIDIFDRADNHLLFVTFDYDSAGNKTGRTVYASDSTFLRSTTLAFDGTGKIVRETSVNFTGDTVFSTTRSYQGNSSTFSVYDQFGLDQLGSPMSLNESSPGTFSVSQSGSSAGYKEVHVFNGDNMLTRINLCDQSNTVIYYAIVTNATSIASDFYRKIRNSASVVFGKSNRLLLRLFLGRKANVSIAVYDLTGRKVSVPVNKNYKSGRIKAAVPVSTAGGKPLASGAYVIRILVDNMNCFTAVRILQR